MAEETQVVKYSVVEADIAQMRSVYMDLVITDLEDVEQFKQVKEARLIVKGKRCAVENERKKLKSDALAWGKKVDGRAKEIFALIEPIETHLAKEEQKVLDEQKRLAEEQAMEEAERVDKRVADLLAVGVTMPRIDVALMDDDEYQCLLGDKTFEFEERQKALAEAKAAEEKRLADEKAEREAEAKRLAKQKAEQDKIAADLKKQQDELEAKYKEMRAEKIRAEAERRLEIDAKAKVEQEAKEASDREMAAKEAEERRFALLPDKERLTEWVNSFELPSEPELDHSNAVDILTSAVEGINDVLGRMQNRIEEL